MAVIKSVAVTKICGRHKNLWPSQKSVAVMLPPRGRNIFLWRLGQSVAVTRLCDGHVAVTRDIGFPPRYGLFPIDKKNQELVPSWI